MSTPIPRLPGEDTLATSASAPYLAELVSYQHPDHDTENWPPRSVRTSHDSTSLRTLYPEIEPFDSGMLDVGDGHHDLLGAGRHAGRQAGGVPAWRAGRRHLAQAPARCSIPKLYDVILFDQRGCGKSTPACRARAPTPPGIWSPTSSGCARWPASTRWLVFGGSWGSTLALAYAETHPERVSELVLRGIFTLTPRRARMVLSVRRLARCSPTSGSASWRRSPRPSAAT